MQTYTRFKKITETKILLFGLMYGLLTIFVRFAVWQGN